MLRTFDPPDRPWGSGHRGVDLAADVGAPVLSVADGVVSHVGVIAGRATISVTHAGGLRSTYEPVEATVAEGAIVVRGQPLGSVAGAGGHCDQPCLHLGAIRDRTYLDPLLRLRGARIILLPLRR